MAQNVNAAAGDVSEVEVEAVRNELVGQGGTVQALTRFITFGPSDGSYEIDIDPEPIASAALLAASKVRENSRGDLVAADEAQMALCQLDWIKTLPDVSPHRVETIRLALERAAALRSAPAEQDGGWMPIDAKCKDGTWVIATREGTHPDTGDLFTPCVVHFADGGWAGDGWPEWTVYEPTHYLPLSALPAPPRSSIATGSENGI